MRACEKCGRLVLLDDEQRQVCRTCDPPPVKADCFNCGLPIQLKPDDDQADFYSCAACQRTGLNVLNFPRRPRWKDRPG